ncbi:ankyrin repeat-containing domain protein [Dunaliella salina]|uniref:Ankyrin repeat-containing domain protein n=1 Tax=Dunaliella salina TaxID=3046 RepID=A0ABQ7GJ85_DUNSA|nr:ankyrin repeat-containing domain protein [Dunaliella salina]|eukprot:KAF5834673.1 ankyrin repeat-containing domain protein [Dunaliella salina]
MIKQLLNVFTASHITSTCARCLFHFRRTPLTMLKVIGCFGAMVLRTTRVVAAAQDAAAQDVAAQEAAAESAAVQEAAAEEAAAASIHCLPGEVLLHILSFVERPRDLRACFGTNKGARAAAKDPALQAAWLLKNRPQSALSMAAQRRQGDVVLQLLKQGVSATAWVRDCSLSSYNYGPIALAAKYDLPEVVDWLWNRPPVCYSVRADVEEAVEALFLAAKYGCPECLQLLLLPLSPVHANIKRPGDSMSLLHAAVSRQKGKSADETVRVLASFGASCEARDKRGRSPLHVACSNSRALYSMIQADVTLRTVRALLDAPQGMSVIDSQDGRGFTPLHCAAKNGLMDCCAELVKRGARVSIHSKSGRKPYQVAEDEGFDQIRGDAAACKLKLMTCIQQAIRHCVLSA